MNKGTKLFSTVLLCAALTGPLAGCGGDANGAPQQAEPEQTEQTEEVQTVDTTTQTAPTDDGRLDLQADASILTFAGDKAIASDATDTQQGMETSQSGFGHQEVSVIKQPESWTDISQIGMGRNYISYQDITQPWGTLSYEFQYHNDATVEAEDELEWSQTTPEAFFGSMEDVQQIQTNGHTVYYVRDDAPSVAEKFAFEDMEAMLLGEERDTSNDVRIHAYEQRADKCSFTVAIKCEANEGATIDMTDEQIVEQAFAVVNYVEGDKANAASYLSDVAITSADDTKQLVIKRTNNDLMGFSKHAVAFSQPVQGDELHPSLVTVYDFSNELDEEAFVAQLYDTSMYSAENGYDGAIVGENEDHDIDGITVHARMMSIDMMWDEDITTSYQVCAWMEIDGKLLSVRAEARDNEEISDVLARVVKDRIEVK